LFHVTQISQTQNPASHIIDVDSDDEHIIKLQSAKAIKVIN